MDSRAESKNGRATLNSNDEAWFAISAVALKREAVERKDGYTALMPPRGGAGGDEEEGMDVDGEKQGDGEARSQREFLLWEMVNGVDAR